MVADIRFAFRMLRKSPASTLIIVLTLALGVGVNTAMFSWADALLWQPLPLPGMDQLMAVAEQPAGQANWDTVAPANWQDWSDGNRSFERLAAYQHLALNISGSAAEPENVLGARVSGDFFDVLRVKPLSGRTFSSADAVPGHDDVVVISQILRQRRFGSDTAILGKTMTVDGRRRTIIGVMPQELDYPLPSDLWVPLSLTDAERSSRSSHTLQVIGRLSPGTPVERARDDLGAIARRLEAEYQSTNKGRGVRIFPVRDLLAPDLTKQLTYMMLFGAAFVLLIACVNVANVQLARAAGRTREAAVRLALGATRWDLVRQLMVESVLLATAGGILAAVFHSWSIDIRKSTFPPELARYVWGFEKMTADYRAFLFTLLLAVLAGILAGVAPALQTSRRVNLNETLKDSGRTGAESRRQHLVRNILVVGQVALTLILLIGAVLMAKGFSHMIQTHRQLEPERLLTMRVNLNAAKYAQLQTTVSFAENLLAEAGALHGVETAAVAAYLPHAGWNQNQTPLGMGGEFSIEGFPEPDAYDRQVTDVNSVSPGYLRTVKIPLLRGRGFKAEDGLAAPRVAIVSERFVGRYFRGLNPIGHRVKFGRLDSSLPWMTIVGVCGDVQLNLMVGQAPQPMLYAPFAQQPSRMLALAMRLPPERHSSAVASARAILTRLDPDLPVFDIRTMRRAIELELLGLRLVAGLMLFFGIIALSLATIGVYGVLSCAVRERTHEIGVRIAMGAGQREVLASVLKRGMTLAAVGLAIGLPVSVIAYRAVASLLFGVEPTDPAAFIGVTAVIVLVSAAACYFPARRAARVDPMITLRSE